MINLTKEEERLELQKTYTKLREQLLKTERTSDEMQALERMLDNIETFIGKDKGELQALSEDILNHKVLTCLGNDYTAVFLLDCFTGAFDIVINKVTNHSAKVQKRPSWDEYVRNYADNYVLEDSRTEMKRVLGVYNLQRHFMRYKDLYFRFHTPPNIIGQSYFEVHVVPQNVGDIRYLVLGFRCVDRIVAKERTYQKQLDEAYRQVRKQLDIVSASIPGGIKISNDDATYSFKYVSTQYARMLGYTSVEEFMQASGGSIVGIAHPDDLETGIAEALKQYEKRNHYAITYRMRCKNGSYKYIEDHGHKVLAADGTIEHWNLILDKDELVRKTIELETAKKADEMKTAFMSRMSHDIRTPLNGIIGLFEYAERHPENKEQIEENSAKAKIAAKHLLALVNDILELNKLGEKQVALAHESVDFSELWQDIRTIAEMRAEDRHIRLFMADGDTLPHNFICCSPLHVKQIFINLLSNAIKYNKSKGSVWCTLEQKELPDGKLLFTVQIKDNGIGMTQKFLKRIYQPFVQATTDEARTSYSGSGLGMAIVKSLVDRMGGTIDIQSELGEGTNITVQLVFEKALPEEMPAGDVMAAAPDLKGIKALLVEDNKLNRDLATFLLEDAGIKVTTSCDGAEAVERFKSSKPGDFDIILMDIMMPVMDGLEATQHIRALERKDAKTIPIFAMTANAFSDDVEAVKQAGMNEHVAKPVDTARLLKKIYQYCHK